MMKSKLVLILSLPFMLFSCFSDKSTDATQPISEITIESGIDSIYNIQKNDTLVIAPKITQTDSTKALSYTWEIDLVPTSYDEKFTFVGNSLGKYQCRLIVSNEDGKSFFPFTLYVNSPYEEGITILSKDAQGKSMISFMQKPTNGEEPEFVSGDCFAINNPEYSFAAGAADIVQCGGSLIVVCQGGGENNDDPTIYYLNEKTFDVENMVPVTEFEDFKPTKLAAISTSYSATSYPLLCENGKVYDLSTTEGVVSKPRKLHSTYEQNCIVVDQQYYCILFWDKDNNGLSLIYRGDGPYYCSSEYHLTLDNQEFSTKNYFANRELIAMTKVNMTPTQIANAGNTGELLIITNYSVIARSEVLCSDFWGYDFTTNTQTFPVASTQTGALINSPINKNTPCIANKTFYTLLFANGNKVRRWKYDTPLANLANAETLLTVGGENAVITHFEISNDHKKTYVAFYEPDSTEELNGSMWVFDTDTGEVLEEHNNICYQPVKMIYKKK